MTPPALLELEIEQKKLDYIGKEQEQSIRYFEGTMLGMAGNYIIFQAIIFLSVTNHAYLPCNYRWVPFYLSLLIGVVFAITFKLLISNWERTRFDYDKNFLLRDWIHYQIDLFPKSASKCNSTYQNCHQQQQQPEKLECDQVKLYLRYAFITLVAGILLAYTIIIINACNAIVCHR